MSHAPEMDTNTTDRSKSPASPGVGCDALLGGLVNVEEARRLYGETEYEYVKEWLEYRPRIGHRVSTRQIISKEEYDLYKDESKKKETARFFGDHKTSFYRYEVKMNKAGWRQKLIEQLNALEADAASSA